MTATTGPGITTTRPGIATTRRGISSGAVVLAVAFPATAAMGPGMVPKSMSHIHIVEHHQLR
jgi:hypothetical protein